MYDIPILMLHSVNNKHNINPMGSLSIYPSELEGYLSAFKLLKYQIISMSDFLEKNYEESQRYIVLTFDDGFKDNLYYAKNILEKYDARATIFINPGYSSKNKDISKVWGFMSKEELIEAERSGVFDLQSHSMTHEFIFKSDRIIDFYTKNKFENYYWLSWMLFPESPNTWSDDAYKYADLIPEGYPIFEYDRRLSSQKFSPNETFINRVINMYKKTQDKENLIKVLNEDTSEKGIFESYDEYKKEIKFQLGECKSNMEQLLKKDINVLCFPGGGYNQEVLKIAEELGYKCYMNASKLKNGNNYSHLRDLKNKQFVGFNRISLSHFENKLLSSKLSAIIIALISLGEYQQNRNMQYMKSFFKKVKRLI